MSNWEEAQADFFAGWNALARSFTDRTGHVITKVALTKSGTEVSTSSLEYLREREVGRQKRLSKLKPKETV